MWHGGCMDRALTVADAFQTNHPRCRSCHRLARPSLQLPGDLSFMDPESHRARYTQWKASLRQEIKSNSALRVAILELGAAPGQRRNGTGQFSGGELPPLLGPSTPPSPSPRSSYSPRRARFTSSRRRPCSTRWGALSLSLASISRVCLVLLLFESAFSSSEAATPTTRPGGHHAGPRRRRGTLLLNLTAGRTASGRWSDRRSAS